MQPASVLEGVEGDEDEDDADYVPPEHDDGDLSNEEPDAKRVKINPPELSAEQEAEKKRAAEALWQSFKASATASSSSTPAATVLTKTVKVEKRYRFAGEDVVEVVDVPEDSEDAKKWPRWASPLEISRNKQDKADAASLSSLLLPIPSPAPASSTFTPASTSTLAKPAKRPGPRRPKTTLAPLPGQQPKAKKLTVLDKSAMDWKSHVATSSTDSGLQDELAANRRGGGYLEKVEFLQRVGDRREEALEASKAGKRRRG